MTEFLSLVRVQRAGLSTGLSGSRFHLSSCDVCVLQATQPFLILSKSWNPLLTQLFSHFCTLHSFIHSFSMLLPRRLLNILTVILYLIPPQLYDRDILIIIPVLQKRRPKHRKVKQLAHSHTASKQQGIWTWDSEWRTGLFLAVGE